MGKQSRLREVRKVAARERGVSKLALRHLESSEAVMMNVNTGKIRIRPKRK